jgi:hypothetical protein
MEPKRKCWPRRLWDKHLQPLPLSPTSLHGKQRWSVRLIGVSVLASLLFPLWWWRKEYQAPLFGQALSTVTVTSSIRLQTQKYWIMIPMASGPGPNGKGILPADPAWASLKSAHFAKLVNELGINTIRLDTHFVDVENTRDYWTPTYWATETQTTSRRSCRSPMAQT